MTAGVASRVDAVVETLAVSAFERRFFDGFLEPEDGSLRPDLSLPGLGVELRRADAARYAV
jgi:hypothetical protein